jgi:transcription elongation factor Elf1
MLDTSLQLRTGTESRSDEQGKERAVGVTRKSELDTPLACPHCGKEIAASQAAPGNVGRALREKIAMTCPHCGREFYVTLDPGDALMTYVVALDPPANPGSP